MFLLQMKEDRMSDRILVMSCSWGRKVSSPDWEAWSVLDAQCFANNPCHRKSSFHRRLAYVWRCLVSQPLVPLWLQFSDRESVEKVQNEEKTTWNFWNFEWKTFERCSETLQISSKIVLECIRRVKTREKTNIQRPKIRNERNSITWNLLTRFSFRSGRACCVTERNILWKIEIM